MIKVGYFKRPILRGRDIKRYSYEFAEIYLITTLPSLKIDIDCYPAVKQHLLSFGLNRLRQTGDKGSRKKTNNKWFETQDSISYWEVKEYHNLVRYFTNKNISVSYLRAKKANNSKRVLELYGTANQKYW